MLQHKMYLATLKGSHQIGSKNMMRQYGSYFRKSASFSIYTYRKTQREVRQPSQLSRPKSKDRSEQ